MTYTILDGIHMTGEGDASDVEYGPALVFIDADPWSGLSVPPLILHGDPDNLVGMAKSPEPPHIKWWRSGPSLFRGFSAILEAHAADGLDTGHPFGEYLGEAVKLLESKSVVETAARVSGLARVTGNFKDYSGRRIVMATPLYVQYAARQSGKISKRSVRRS